MDLSTKGKKKDGKKKKKNIQHDPQLSNPAFAMISEFCNHNFEPEKLEEEKKRSRRKNN
jgi:hypothetical protein